MASSKMKMKKITVVNLPQEIIIEILLRLPVRSVIKFRCVSKSWYAFVDRPDFRRRHLSLAKQQINLKNVIVRSCPLTFSPLSVMLSDNPCIEDMATLDYYYPMLFYGFCDGLICAKISGGWTDAKVSLLNPSTGESKTLPASPFEFPKSVKSSSVYVTFGIGYNSVSDDYNILRMAMYPEFGSEYSGYEMKLYSLKNNSWRKIHDFPRPLFYTSPVCCFLNGAFHWFTSHTSFHEDGPCVVVSFDVSEEKYGEIPIPRLNYSTLVGSNGGRKNSFMLAALSGMLCISCSYSSGSFHLWAMKEYGVEDSWTNLFTICFDPSEPYVSFEARYLFENGEILLEASLANGERKLVIYQGERFGFRTLIANSINVVSYGYVYEQSLVSLSGRN